MVNKEEPYYVPCTICGKTEFVIMIRPDTFYRFVCPECKTPTYVYVSQRLEVIMIREDELCPECGGTGRCRNCDGTGKAKCPHCEGRGWIYDTDDEFYYPCPYCGGSQKSSDFRKYHETFLKDVFRGDIKLGSGVGTCSICMGSGICPSCHGLRFKPRSPGKE